jgi:hypothetical protein
VEGTTNRRGTVLPIALPDIASAVPPARGPSFMGFVAKKAWKDPET